MVYIYSEYMCSAMYVHVWFLCLLVFMKSCLFRVPASSTCGDDASKLAVRPRRRSPGTQTLK